MKRTTNVSIVALAALLLAAPARAEDDAVMQALVDELSRSMTIQLEDLQSPYFVQYAVSESDAYRISATCGAVVTSDDARSRRLSTSVRVGYYDLDNTNFAGGGGRGMRARGRGRRGPRGGGGGGGGVTPLPIDDNYTAVRQATWRATDTAYKAAVETLAQKQAYMEDRKVEDRPDDFARVEPVVSIDEKAALDLDVELWEQRLRMLSARFLDYPHVLDSQVVMMASADNRYLVNSEGARIRTGGTGVMLTISAKGQADDGEMLSDLVTVHAAAADDLPGEAALLAKVDGIARRLTGRVESPVLEDYVGPVLFDGRAAPQLFQATLARGVTGRADPVGGGRRRFAGMQSLDKYLGKRVLPRSFNVYDDPGATPADDVYLAGRYSIDDEGVEAQRVDVVVNGKLKGMVMSRTPTRDFEASTGHGRGGGRAGTRASIGCLFVEAGDGVIDEALKTALIEEARAQDLEYGLRVTLLGFGGGQTAIARARALAGGGGGAPSVLGDPIVVYKVHLDGREELVRGCEFGSFDVGNLKDIIAAGLDPIVQNGGTPMGTPVSVVAPAVLFDELELFTIEEERQKPPLVEVPHRR